MKQNVNLLEIDLLLKSTLSFNELSSQIKKKEGKFVIDFHANFF